MAQAMTERSRGQEYDSARTYDLSPPKLFSQQGINDLQQPDGDCPDGKQRFYAVAQIDGVRSTGPDAIQSEDVRSVLYVSSDLQRAVTFDYIDRLTPFEQTPAVKDIDPDNENVGEMSDETAENYVDVLDRHFTGGDH